MANLEAISHATSIGPWMRYSTLEYSAIRQGLPQERGSTPNLGTPTIATRPQQRRCTSRMGISPLALALLLSVMASVVSGARMLSNDSSDYRLVGGKATTRSRHPYFVRITDKQDEHICGGALITSTVVLCAAHCKQGKPFWIHVNGAKIKVDKQTMHKRFEQKTYRNDLMLLSLSEASSAEPLRIAKKKDIDAALHAKEVAVIGWGGSDDLSDLRIAMLDYVPNKKCQDGYESFGYTIYDDMMCAARKGNDACNGSSGGPLIVKGKSPAEDLQVGVVSWGIGCAELPGVYSRLVEGRKWIKKTVKQFGSELPKSKS